MFDPAFGFDTASPALVTAIMEWLTPLAPVFAFLLGLALFLMVTELALMLFKMAQATAGSYLTVPGDGSSFEDREASMMSEVIASGRGETRPRSIRRRERIVVEGDVYVWDESAASWLREGTTSEREEV